MNLNTIPEPIHLRPFLIGLFQRSKEKTLHKDIQGENGQMKINDLKPNIYKFSIVFLIT